MKKSLKAKMVILSAAAAASVCSMTMADITSFTPGDLVVIRAGTGGSALPSSGAVPAFLDQYTTAGGFAGTVTLPTTNTAGSNALDVDVLSNGNHEAVLTRSDNGNWLTFGGFNGAGGSGSANGTLGEISQNVSTLNTATSITGQGQLRGVGTTDGNEFWTTTGSIGVQYIGSLGGSATALNTAWNGRAITTIGPGANLISGSGSDSFNNSGGSALNGHNVHQIGTTPPPTGAQTSSNLKALINDGTADDADGTDFVFASLPGGLGSYNGYDVMYTVGGKAGAQAIGKYAFNGSEGLFDKISSITPAGGVSATLLGLTAGPDGSGNEDLYYTTPAGLFELTDSSQTATGAITATPSTTPLVANGANEEILGVAFAPTAVPEPGSIGLLTVAGAGLLARRRRMSL